MTRRDESTSATQTIYVRLLDEGTDVWRPVEAAPLGGELFRILGAAPEDENWEFAPGRIVRCRERTFQTGTPQLVAYAPGPGDA